MPHAMKIPAAKAAAHKEWEKLEKISEWNLTKVRSKKEVIDESRMSGASVHFASLIDVCHLKNAELEGKHQKFKSRDHRYAVVVGSSHSMDPRRIRAKKNFTRNPEKLAKVPGTREET